MTSRKTHVNEIVERFRVNFQIACENIRFSSLFAAGDVSRGNVPSGEERGETDVFAG